MSPGRRPGGEDPGGGAYIAATAGADLSEGGDPVIANDCTKELRG